MRCLLLILTFALSAPAAGQALVDTVFAWSGYARPSRCHVRVYPSLDEARPHTVVLEELAESAGRTTVEDAPLLAELVGRALGLDPTAVTWVVHWGPFSFAGAAPRPRKELFLRATFRRGRSGALTTPAWRILGREEVEDLTDRRWTGSP